MFKNILKITILSLFLFPLFALATDINIMGNWILEDIDKNSVISQDLIQKIENDYSIRLTHYYTNLYYNAQLKENIDIEQSKFYSISFWAKSTGNYPIVIELRKEKDPFTNYGLWESININKDWQKYQYSFASNSSDSLARLAFDIGSGSGTLWLNNIKVETSQIPKPAFPELIWNGDFENGNYSYWATNSLVNGGDISIDNNGFNSNFSIKLTNPLMGSYNQVQLYQNSILIKAYRSYTLTFWAKSTGGDKLYIELTKDSNPWINYGIWDNFEMGRSWQKYTFRFISKYTDPNAKLSFSTGKTIGSVWIDNVSLKPDLPIFPFSY